MSQNNYIIRRKIVQFKPTPIPKSTYTPETFVQKPTPPPVTANKHIEKLAEPKVLPPPPDPLPPIPKYQNPPPNFKPVDFRVNAACLQRDAYLMKSKNEKEKNEKDNEPSQFIEWQEKMKSIDDQKNVELVQQRHEALDNVQKNAIKAKKKIIEDRLEQGRQLRLNIGEDIQKVQDEIEQERQKIRDLKNQLVDGAPKAVAKSKRQKAEQAKEMKIQLRGEIRAAQKQRAEETAEIKLHAQQVRKDAENHVMSHGDKFKSKVDITETKFLASLTDEETKELIRRHQEQKQEYIQQEIQKHREQKSAKMDQLLKMLEEATKQRDLQEQEHLLKKQEKLQKEEKERIEKEEEEERKILALEKKLEKKREDRIKEAEEMEEHTRQIAARNRYLALNKKALATKVFQSQQDAKLRSAKERQSMNLQMDQIKTMQRTQNQRKSAAELTSLKGLLGLK